MEKELKEIQNLVEKEDFWSNQENSQKILKRKSELGNVLEKFSDGYQKYEDLATLLELYEEDDIESIDADVEAEIEMLIATIDQLELSVLLGGQDDDKNALITINPGAGGTESQDWAEMLFRMYKRWSEKESFKFMVIDYQDGEQAGLKSASVRIVGDYAFGRLKSETGVHRLVRISPFDSGGRRHTSFASVFVYPEVDDDIEIDLNMSDVRIDTYRASGAGGQHVNKTDSAVRLTHEPTGIVVQCQDGRSQHQNKDTAIKMLKSRLYQLEREKQDIEKKKIEGEKKEIGFGSQIRSYVFHPYNMVKDHRTNSETSNTASVMDGDINQFIKAFLNMRRT
jgi:peptide chain release factor 2